MVSFPNFGRKMKNAVIFFQESAAQGAPTAQLCLDGVMYESSHGVLLDYARAVEWSKKAANQVDAHAQSNLGLMCNNGWCFTERAVGWYRKAVNQGSAKAQNNLGFIYTNDHRVSQDHTRAVELYTKAANQGYAYAQCNMGSMYCKSYGVSQDYEGWSST